MLFSVTWYYNYAAYTSLFLRHYTFAYVVIVVFCILDRAHFYIQFSKTVLYPQQLIYRMNLVDFVSYIIKMMLE